MPNFLPVTEQLRILFSTRLHPNVRPYTMQEISDGTGISLASISAMKTGRIKNPQLNTLRALCTFFDLPLHYFQTRTPEECYSVLQKGNAAAMTEISEIGLRIPNLSPEAQQDVLTVIRWIQAAERSANDNDAASSLPHLTYPSS